MNLAAYFTAVGAITSSRSLAPIVRQGLAVSAVIHVERSENCFTGYFRVRFLLDVHDRQLRNRGATTRVTKARTWFQIYPHSGGVAFAIEHVRQRRNFFIDGVTGKAMHGCSGRVTQEMP